MNPLIESSAYLLILITMMGMAWGAIKAGRNMLK